MGLRNYTRYGPVDGCGFKTNLKYILFIPSTTLQMVNTVNVKHRNTCSIPAALFFGTQASQSAAAAAATKC